MFSSITAKAYIILYAKLTGDIIPNLQVQHHTHIHTHINIYIYMHTIVYIHTYCNGVEATVRILKMIYIYIYILGEKNLWKLNKLYTMDPGFKVLQRQK